MHANDAQLRAQLDGELAPADEAELNQHVSTCPICQARQTELKRHAEFVAGKMAQAGPENSPAGAEERVWRSLESRISEQPAGVQGWRPRWSLGWALAGAAVLLLASLTFAPVRVWAGQFLGLFRVKEIAVLPVDVTQLSQLSGDTPFTEQVAKIISSDITMVRPPRDPELVATAAQASDAVGFTVRLPTSRADAPKLVVQSGEAFQMTVDRGQAQALLDELDVGKLTLPQALDGAQISVNIPAGVTAGYGDCPGIELPDPSKAGTSGSPGRRYINCVMLVEVPSPTVNTPPDLDVSQLAAIGLQLSGMSAAEAQAYSQTVDWTSTLVIPIPRNGASYHTVNVDGVEGYLIERPVDDAPQYALVWTKGGIIYAIGGLGDGAQAAIEMANSLE
jgi:hypothetical protein